MSSNNSSAANGMGFTGWLTILFVGLKLTGYINWPWIWVLSPIWIGLLIVIFFCLLLLIIAALADFRK